MEKLKLQHDGPLTIATGLSRKETKWKNREISWSELQERLSQVRRTSETYAEYKAMPKRRRDEIKDVGGFVGGTIQTGRRKAENIRWRALVTLDADYADQILSLDDLSFACVLYTTHSHHSDQPRFRLVIPLTRPVTPEEYPAVARRIAADINIEWFDDTTFEPHRLMYWPSAAEDGEFIFRQQDKVWINPDQVLNRYEDWKDASSWPVSSRESEALKKKAKRQGDPLQKPGMVGAFCRTYTITDAIEIFLSEVYEPYGDGRYTYQGGTTAGGMVIYDDDTFAYSHHATDPISGKLVNAFDLVRIHKFGEQDEEVDPDTPVNRLPSYKAMMELAAKDEDVKETLGMEQLGLAKEEFQDEMSWVKQLERHPKAGFVLTTFRNFELILENDPRIDGAFAYDLFACRPAVRKPLPWKSEPGMYDNADDAALRGYIENTYGIRHKERLMDALLTASRKNAFHPVRDYLNSLDWDGIPRLETVFIDYLGVEDNKHIRKLTKKALVAAVKRVYEPGCKFDEMITLVGQQGIGKSQLIYKLSKGWFTDSLDSLNGKEAYESLQGVWLVELAELSAIRRSADVEMVKKFLSKQIDRYRPPYGRVVEEYPRQCIFFGSTNTYEFLVDKTGNRRFWPFRCINEPKFHISELTGEEVDQLWAEAVTYYQEGYPTHLDRRKDAETITWVTGIQHEHTEENSLTGVVREFLEKKLPEDWNDRDISQRRAFLNGDFGEGKGTTQRVKVCVMEVWVEALNRDTSSLDIRSSRDIGAIIESTPGWSRRGRLRFKHYGTQRAFVRNLSVNG